MVFGRYFTVEYEGKYQEVRNMGRADVGLRTRTGFVTQSSSMSCAHERHLHSSGNQDFSKASGSRGSRFVYLFIFITCFMYVKSSAKTL